MLSATIALAVFGLIALLWSSARGAAELAAFYGRSACNEAGVQWLDHTAVLERLSMQRNGEGRLRWLRRYRFEYSQGGDDRQRGTIALLGDELQWIRMSTMPKQDQINPLLAESPTAVGPARERGFPVS